MAIDGSRRKALIIDALLGSLLIGFSFGVCAGVVYWLDRGDLLDEGLFFKTNFRPELLTATARFTLNMTAVAWWITFPVFYWINVRTAR
jgi:hypothetical protein